MPCHAAVSGDQQLIQIVDAALADSVRRSGKWLACRPGCSQCCVGAFAINQLDAARVRAGLEELERQDPERAIRVRARVNAYVTRLADGYPGDPRTGVLDESEEASQRWDDFANDEPCPVLDPGTGTCDLYHSRPMTCRTFGPPLMSDGELGVCELCFDGVTDEEVAACEIHPDPDHLEAVVLKELEKSTHTSGNTIVGFALACQSSTIAPSLSHRQPRVTDFSTYPLPGGKDTLSCAESGEGSAPSARR